MIDILLLVLLGLWPVIGILSIMVLGGPGASNQPGKVYGVVLTLLYPVALFFLRGFFSKPFLRLPPWLVFGAVTVTVVGALWLLGFIEMAQNTRRGILNEGYTVATERVYYNGKVLPEADAKTFKIENDGDPAREKTARDKNHVYEYGQIVQGANPESYREP